MRVSSPGRFFPWLSSRIGFAISFLFQMMPTTTPKNVQSTKDDSPLWTLCWSPDGARLAAAGSDRIIRIYQLKDDDSLIVPLQELTDAHRKTIRSLDWHDNMLAAASFDGTVSVWQETANGIWRCMVTLEGHESEVKAVRFSPDGRRLATCGRDRTVWIWSVLHHHDNDDVEFECEAVLQEHQQDVKTIEWHPNSRILFSAGYDDSIRVYGCPFDDEDDEWLVLSVRLNAHSSTIWALTCLGTALYSAGADGCITRWVNSNGSSNPFNVDLQPDARFSGLHGDTAIYCLAVNGTTMVSGGADQTLVFSDALTGQQQQVIELSGQVNCVRWNPQLPLLAAALDDGCIALVAVIE